MTIEVLADLLTTRVHWLVPQERYEDNFSALDYVTFFYCRMSVTYFGNVRNALCQRTLFGQDNGFPGSKRLSLVTWQVWISEKWLPLATEGDTEYAGFNGNNLPK